MKQEQKISNGVKKILILIVILLVVGGAVYFITNKKPQEEKEEKSQDAVLEKNQARVSQFAELPEGTPEDLMVGETVTVMGIANQDGSIAAKTIYIGIFEEGFQGFNGRMPGTEEEQAARPNRAGRQLPEGINPEEFQNLSQEERMKRMQELRDSGDFPAREGRMVSGGSGAGFTRGEIIDKDDISITVKLVDGGSRLVFYSDDTEIRKVDKNNDLD